MIKRILLTLLIAIMSFGIYARTKTDYSHPVEKERIIYFVVHASNQNDLYYGIDLCKDKYNNNYIIVDTWEIDYKTFVKQLTFTTNTGEVFTLKKTKVLRSYSASSIDGYSGTINGNNISITPTSRTIYSIDKKVCFAITPDQVNLIKNHIIQIACNKQNLPCTFEYKIK